MSNMSVGGQGYGYFEAPGDETEAATASCPASAGGMSPDRMADLPADELARYPAAQLIPMAERHPEVAARLPLAKLAEIGNARPDILSMIFRSDAASVPECVPHGYFTGTHVWEPNSGVDLPFLVQQGVNAWKGKEFDGRGEMIDHVGGIIPNSKAKAYIGDVNAAIQGAAGGGIAAPVEADGRGALITDYTQHSQAFGVKLHWIDEFRRLPNGTLLGVSYWMDGATPKKWSYVLLDPQK